MRKKAVERAKKLKKLTNRVRDIVDPNNKQSHHKKLKQLDKLLHDLNKLAMEEGQLDHSAGAAGMALLEQIRQLFDTFTLGENVFGTFTFDDIPKDLRNIREKLQEKREIALGKRLVGDLDQLLNIELSHSCLLYTSPSPRDRTRSRMPSSA